MKKKQNEKYFIALAEKIEKAGVVDVLTLTDLVSEVNVAFGGKPLGNKNSIYMVTKKLSEVLGDCFEVTKIESKGSDGRDMKKNFYSIKKEYRDKIYRHFDVSPTRVYSGTISKQDQAHRDACLKVAKEVREGNPNLDQKEAVFEARKMVTRLTEEIVKKAWEIIPKMKVGKSLDMKKSDIGVLQSKVINTFKAYGVDLGIVTGKKLITFKRDMHPVAEEVRDLAWNVLKMKLNLPVVEIKRETPLSKDEDYAILVIGGLIMKNGGKFVEIPTITKVLRSNHYRKVDLSGNQVEKLVKRVPDLLQLNRSSGVSLVGEKDETWNKIQDLYSPKHQGWIIPWCVNSGLKLEEVQRVFPESYAEREDVTVGSRIIMIKTNRSIEAFMRLARLSEKFRDIDFPIGESNLVEKLKQENSFLEANMLNLMLGKINPDDWRGCNPDKLLLQIEEGYI